MRKGVGTFVAVLLVGFGVGAWHRAEAFSFCASFGLGGGARARGLHHGPPPLRPRLLPWRAAPALGPPVVRTRPPVDAVRTPQVRRENPWRALLAPAEGAQVPAMPAAETKEPRDR